MSESKPVQKPAAVEGRRDVDLVMREDIALGLARPRKLPRQDPSQR